MFKTLAPSSPEAFRVWFHAQTDPFCARQTSKVQNYLPIETFRDEQPERFFNGSSVARTFRSSGTTDKLRSRSLFSNEGLDLYRSASLLTFFAAIGKATGLDPFSLTGASFIPRCAQWPDSSLAQMIEWIAEIVPVLYVSHEKPLPHFSRPIWLFGTAFHHILYLDSHKEQLSLHEKSLVIETGGTKGQSRNMGRSSFHDWCRDVYQAPILSEYGMCELASQAYDWGDGFLFPSWVKIAAVSGRRTITHDRGLLLVEDPMRADFCYPLRTEDMVEIRSNLSFNLLGRAQFAPLKGCSLNVEDPPRSTPIRKETPITFFKLDPLSQIEERARYVAKKLSDFLLSDSALYALEEEFSSKSAANQCIQDLLKAIPADLNNWIKAAFNAAGNQKYLPKNWIFILPRNHSLVAVYPLAMALVLGIHVKIRLPNDLCYPNNFAHQISKLFEIELISPTHDLPLCDAILCYGNDDTLAAVRKQNPEAFFRGYGSHLAISTAESSSLREQAPLIIRDSLATAQRGCLAPRLVIMHMQEEISTLKIASSFLDAAQAFWQKPLPQALELGFEREANRLERKGFVCYGGMPGDSALISTLPVTRELLKPEFLIEVCAQVPFSFPVLLLDLQKTPNEELNSWQESIFAPFPRSIKRVPLIGSANAIPWDGLHLGIPLFAD